MVHRAEMRARAGWRVVAVALAMLALAVGTAQATHTTPDTAGHTTVEQRVDGGDPATDYQQLGLVSGEEYTVRDGDFEGTALIPVAQDGRESRRQSLSYFSQMTDFQLADEESPARVEFVDPGPSSAWRPQEAFVPFMVEYSVRQINAFAQNSPFPGSDVAMDFALITGDQADNQHRNETVWIRELLEGADTGDDPITFNGGLTDPDAYSLANMPSPTCQAFVLQEGGQNQAAAEGAAYTGVQDHADYNSVTTEAYFYDPNQPSDTPEFEHWPQYTGLMDRAQQIQLTPVGLAVPFYLTNGNHDMLAQGNEDANQAFEDVATGCSKVVGETTAPPNPSVLQSDLEDVLEGNFTGAEFMLIPPDPERQYVSKAQIKELYGDCEAVDPLDPAALQQCLEDDPQKAHGFGLVDPEENAASNGSASYYSWEPIPGIQFISIDTTSEGGQTAEGVAPGSSNGNLDDPQFQWLQAELEAAQAANKLIVLFGHHPVRSMNTLVADEQAPPCTGGDDGHEHDPNPGCDLDPRVSEPIHLGNDPASPGRTFVDLLEDYPNVIAYVPGHTHEHRLTPFTRPDGTAWWELNTSAVVDHPTQSRLIELFDNQDGTLSIFTNVIDHASSAGAPAAGPATSFNANQLASIGRTFAYNDPQTGAQGGEGEGEGAVEDRNAELLLDDPRDGPPNPGGNPPGEVAGGPAGGGGATCKGKRATIVGTAGDDTLQGTDGNDVIIGLGGADDVRGGAGNDRICGKRGKDNLRGNRGEDRVQGGGGRDKARGGPGDDDLRGGRGKDKLKGGAGKDRCGGGPGRDRGRNCEQGRDADE